MIADKIRKLIEEELEDVETVALGIITQVDLQKPRCNVKLKHKIKGQEIELFDVPIVFPKFHGSSIIFAPHEGDVVLVVFSKYELEEQLKNRETVAVNEIFRFNVNNAIVIAGVYTLVDKIPPIQEDEILIWHRTGAYIKFKADGSIEIRGKSINIREDLTDGEIESNKQIYY